SSQNGLVNFYNEPVNDGSDDPVLIGTEEGDSSTDDEDVTYAQCAEPDPTEFHTDPETSWEFPAQQELNMLIAQYGTRSSHNYIPSQHKYNFQKAIIQTESCHVMAYSELLGCLMVAQESSRRPVVLTGCGVKKLDVGNMESSQYIPIHSKQIRGLAFNSRSDGLLLSAAMDCTVKLTSLLTNTVVQTCNAEQPLWSCCWCSDDFNYIYAGLISGVMLVYDLRNMSKYVEQLSPRGPRSPLISLSYMPRAASEVFPCGGVLAGSLRGAYFWEMKDAKYTPHLLPLESGGCTDIQIESSTRQCLVTYRPDQTHNYMRSVMMKFTSNRLADSADRYKCSCSPVQTFNMGNTCKHLTKNAIFPIYIPDPDKNDGILVCAGDESSNSAMLWHSRSGSLIQKLQADEPVLDICPMKVNQTSLLATLTEKKVKIYRWE
ncbi:unnamed protein product, partial [Staurois parvus]